MGVGYTTIMYDGASLETGISDIAACQYDGVEIGLGKVRANGADTVRGWLDQYDLDLYLVMSDWIESESTVDQLVSDIPTIADLGAEFVGLLPPQRHRHDDQTVEAWLGTLADAAVDAGLTPLVHHHGATAVEQPDEIRRFLDASGDLQLVWDTAHYYPYSEGYPDGDLTDGVERFADDIAYVHLKDISPGTEFADNRDSLSEGDFHLDNVINYFRAFTDLGEGVLDFPGIYDALEAAGYDGHYTIEIENETERPLVHAKQNLDCWNDVVSGQAVGGE